MDSEMIKEYYPPSSNEPSFRLPTTIKEAGFQLNLVSILQFANSANPGFCELNSYKPAIGGLIQSAATSRSARRKSSGANG
jgi:hypothetical protein